MKKLTSMILCLFLLSCSDQIEFDSDYDLSGYIYEYDDLVVNDAGNTLYLIRDRRGWGVNIDSLTVEIDAFGNPQGLILSKYGWSDGGPLEYYHRYSETKKIVLKNWDIDSLVSGSFKYKFGSKWVNHNFYWEKD